MRLAAVSLAALLAVNAPALAGPKVVASVVPVHGIVAAVMGDTGTPELLLEGKLSEHRATFTADQISTLGKADVVFIIGHGLEAKLAQISGSEAVNGKTFVELSEAPGVKTLPIREGGAWEAHDHDHDHGEGGEAAEAGHDHGETAEAGHDHDHDKKAEAGMITITTRRPRPVMITRASSHSTRMSGSILKTPKPWPPPWRPN